MVIDPLEMNAEHSMTILLRLLRLCFSEVFEIVHKCPVPAMGLSIDEFM